MTKIKNVPEKIYLQIGEELDGDEDFNNLYGVSWCADKINENDIEFVREVEPMSKTVIMTKITAKEFWKQKFGEYPQTDSEKLAVVMMTEYALQNKVSDEGKDRIIKLKDNYIQELDELLQSRASEIKHLQNCLSKYKNQTNE